jgi:PAS domain S-box-containing protein
MAIELRKTGISVVGDMPWGTHFCCFYETKEDLLDILVPYFKVGLENDEFCLWVISISELLTVEEATTALRKALPDLDRYMAEGSIEVVAHDEWFLEGRAFDLHRVVNRFKQKVDEALARGYAGMRVNGSPAWMLKEDGKELREFEGELDKLFPNERIIASCTYPLAGSGAAELLDVTRTHQFAIARRHGNWELIETPELKQAKAEIKRLNKELEQRVVERTRELATANEGLRREIIERKRVEEELRASEARLQAATDAAEIGLWDWDLVSGHIIWLGHHEKLFGFAPGEFDGTYPSFEKRVHPEDLEELNRVVQRARSERSEYGHEYRVIWPDGSIHWIAGRGRFVYNDTGQPVRMYGAVIEITERKQAEEALRQSEFDLAEAQRVARLGSWSFDIATNTVRWSEELYRIFDIEKTAFGGTYETFLSRVHPDERTRILQVNTEARSSGEPFEVEYRVTTRSGQLKHIREVGYARKDSAGAVSGLFGTAQDITERKQAEAAIRSLLQISEKLHATLDIDALLDSLVIEAMKLIEAEIGWSGLRTEEGMICHTHIARDLQVVPFKYFWPPGAGLPGWVLVHKVPYVMNDAQSDKLIIPEIRERFGVNAAIDTPILDAQGEVIGFFEVNNKKNGAKFSESDVEMLVAVSRIASIALQNAMSYGNLERAEKALRESQLHLQALSRRLLEVQEAERRQIARELHDEIGQALTGIKLILEKTMREPNVAPTLEPALGVTNELIGRVRDLSLELRPAMLDDLGLLPALKWHFERYTSQVDIKVDFKHAGLEGRRFQPEIETAAYRIVQETLTNVARHAMVERAEVNIRADDNMLRIEVRDAGIGFPSGSVTTRNTGGLSGMRERATMLGGQVIVDSVPGGGTLLTAELPL